MDKDDITAISSENYSFKSRLEELRFYKLQDEAVRFQEILNETREEVVRKAYENRIEQINAEIERMKGRAK